MINFFVIIAKTKIKTYIFNTKFPQIDSLTIVLRDRLTIPYINWQFIKFLSYVWLLVV